MKTPIYLSIFLGLFFFVGCEPATDDTDTAAAKSPTELVESAIEETAEFKFCISEEAGMEPLKQSVDRLQKAIEAMLGSVSASGLDQSKKDQVTKLIEALKTASDGLASSVESQASPSELLKANSKIRSDLISISKKLR